MEIIKSAYILPFMILMTSCNDDKIIYTANNIVTVYEYLPAPGQFINDMASAGFNEESSQDEAIKYAQERIDNGKWLSLGGFGGYIIIGFSNSIINEGKYDIEIVGNAYKDSSEPGIVWVMQDANGNNKPDDTWYELQGSESLNPTTRRGYEVTYYKPDSIQKEVRWTDNLGNSGSIDYLPDYHAQGTYYPLWINADSYTLQGTCLATANYESSPNNWVNGAYNWGYVDNYPDIDSLQKSANYFMIENAIDSNGSPVKLGYIDFVKVQTAINSKSGWAGEISTEIKSISAYNKGR